MIDNGTLKVAARQLSEYLEKSVQPWVNGQLKSEEIEKIVETHALGAAAAGIGVAWLPGAGGVAAAAAMVGFIWSMYFRINKAIGLKLSKTLLKTLASAVMSNIAQAAISVVGTVALSTVLSFTGIGNALSSLMMAALDYAVVMVGGIIYLKLLIGLFSAGKDISKMNEAELKKTASTVMEKEDIGEMLRTAREGYKKAKKDGRVTGNESVDLEQED